MCVLGGHMINDWRANTVTHLVMDGLTFTIKVSTLQLCTFEIYPRWVPLM